jgi:hypothetical protein
MIKQRGVRVGEETVENDKYVVSLDTEKIVNVGKRKYLRVIGK